MKTTETKPLRAVPLQRLVSLLLVCAALSACSSKKVQAVEGKVLKDAVGNYYMVRGNVGDTVFLEKLDLSKYEKF